MNPKKEDIKKIAKSLWIEELSEEETAVLLKSRKIDKLLKEKNPIVY